MFSRSYDHSTHNGKRADKSSIRYVKIAFNHLIQKVIGKHVDKSWGKRKNVQLSKSLLASCLKNMPKKSWCLFNNLTQIYLRTTIFKWNENSWRSKRMLASQFIWEFTHWPFTHSHSHIQPIGLSKIGKRFDKNRSERKTGQRSKTLLASCSVRRETSWEEVTLVFHWD